MWFKIQNRTIRNHKRSLSDIITLYTQRLFLK